MSTDGVVFWHSRFTNEADTSPPALDHRRRQDGAADDFDVLSGMRKTLIRLRQALRLSQRQIAEWIGTQQSTVSDFERGETDPRFSVMQSYARGVGCRIRVEIVEDIVDDSALHALNIVHYNSWSRTSVDYDDEDLMSLDGGDPLFSPKESRRYESQYYSATGAHVLYPSNSRIEREQ